MKAKFAIYAAFEIVTASLVLASCWTENWTRAGIFSIVYGLVRIMRQADSDNGF